uniref:Serine aminopeptidase S33 domain-containing protein n=1 Tax=viral metagenome TaxID=1070528 RepID=A0A6C0BDV0_9ZZZZ
MSLNPEDIIYNSNCKNLEKTDEYILIQDKKIHLRIESPDTHIRGILFFCHGYNSHSNRPYQKYLIEFLKNKGIMYISYDYIGHGYSEGDPGQIHDFNFFFEISFNIISYIYTGKSKYNFSIRNIDFEKSVPLFIMGHSIGCSLTVGLYKFIEINLNKSKNLDNLNSENINHKIINLKSLIFISPAIFINKPNNILRFILELISWSNFGSYELMWFMRNDISDSLCWNNLNYLSYIKSDRRNNCMTYLTACNLLKISEYAYNSIKDCKVDILILHDQEEKIIDIKSIEVLIKSISKYKYINVKNGLHDPLSNKTGFVLQEIDRWISLYIN